jgi:anti-anti-sigma factor
MATRDWPQDVTLVTLHTEPHKSHELDAVVRRKQDRDVIVDFSDVDIVGSLILAKLLELRQLLQNSEHSLILCGVTPQAKGVFAVARLDDAFEFAEDKTAALDRLQC